MAPGDGLVSLTLSPRILEMKLNATDRELAVDAKAQGFAALADVNAVVGSKADLVAPL